MQRNKEKELKLSVSRLKELFEYDPVNGAFRALQSRGSSIINQIGGYTDHNGYSSIKIDKESYLEHRLAWFYTYGVWPTQIDHIDGDTTNNRITNLRECTSQQNRFNAYVNKNNTSGYTGVSWDERSKRWKAYIRVNNYLIHLGYFSNLDEAVDARQRVYITIASDFINISQLTPRLAHRLEAARLKARLGEASSTAAERPGLSARSLTSPSPKLIEA